MGRHGQEGQLPNIEVRHETGDRYRVLIRGHEVAVDQPVADGGSDTAPTPAELLVAGLAACTAFNAGRFLGKHGVPTGGLRVDCAFEMASDAPPRVERVQLSVVSPPGLSEAQRKALRRVIEHCTVHNTLDRPPSITVELNSAE